MESLWHQRAGARIRYLDFAGRQPALVCLHGLGSASSADFPAVFAREPLAGRRGILIDLLGFGYSDRPADFGYTLEDHAASAAHVLDRIGIRRAVVIGHSMGGAIAIALSIIRPDLVANLVLAEANLDPGAGGGSKIIAAYTEEDYIAHGHAEFLAALREQAHGEPGLHSYLGALALADPGAMHRSATGLLRGTNPPQRQVLAAMAIPRSFIIGERSLPHYDVDELRRLGLQVFIVADAGHGMMDDNPRGFVEAIAGGIKEESEGSP